jgi:hypothetical protein
LRGIEMPASSCSIYDVTLDTNLTELSRRLAREKIEQEINTIQGPFRLRTYFSGFFVEEGVLHGTIAYESLITIPQIEDRPAFYKSGKTLSFAICPAPHSYYLLCFANRGSSETTARRINKALCQAGFSEIDVVFNHYIPTAFIENFLNNHPNHTLKVCGWKDLDLVGVNKSTLHGADIDRYNGTQVYDLHGHKSYIMVELHDLGLTVRISELGIVTFYGDINGDQILNFLRTEIFPTL